MKFRFPIVIIDEDFRSENTSGLGIRALAQAFESEGFEVLGVTSYGDLSQFAQQQSRASAFILSIDDEEFTPGPDLDPAVLDLRNFITEVRRKNLEVPIYVYGETKTSRHIPNDILRELHGFIHMFFNDRHWWDHTDNIIPRRNNQQSISHGFNNHITINHALFAAQP